MRVLFTGGRDFYEMDRFLDTVDVFEERYGQITEIIQGGATGADRLAHVLYIYLKEQGREIKETQVDADWNTHGKKAGVLRNQWMVDLKPDWCIPMPGGVGTADCVQRCKKANIPLFTI
jgi:hypothetical protein